jgi:hypothetical protein
MINWNDPARVHPRVRRLLNYGLAYLLFALLALAAVALTVNLHTAVVALCIRLKMWQPATYGVYVWGAFLLFLAYIVFIAVLESRLNGAAKTGRVLPGGVKALAVLLGVWGLVLILNRIG